MMNKKFLILILLLFSILSYSQHNHLGKYDIWSGRISMEYYLSSCNYSQLEYLGVYIPYFWTAPVYILVSVKSCSYEGEAIIWSNDFSRYYKKIKSFKRWNEYRVTKVLKEILYKHLFLIIDDDFGINYFEKVIVNDSVIAIAKQGMDIFIRTYFNKEGVYQYGDWLDSMNIPNDFRTVVKVMFDAGIKTGIGCEYSDYGIHDMRFLCDTGFYIPQDFVGMNPYSEENISKRLANSKQKVVKIKNKSYLNKIKECSDDNKNTTSQHENQ